MTKRIVDAWTVGGVRACALAALMTGCVGFRDVPPPAPPPRALSTAIAVPDVPLDPGRSRLVIDAGEPVEVLRSTGAMYCADAAKPGTCGDYETTRARYKGYVPLTHVLEPLCIAPCAADVPAGDHRLVFRSVRDRSRSGVYQAYAYDGRVVGIRHVLGEFPERSPQTWVAGNALLGTGALLTAAGALVSVIGVSDYADDGRGGAAGVAAGGALLVAGVTAVVLGYRLADKNRPVVRPSATTQWVLE